MATAYYNPVRTIGTVTSIALTAAGLYWAAQGVTSFGLLNDQPTFASDDWLETLTSLESAYPAVFVITGVLFLIWSFGAHSNLRHLGRQPLRHQDQATIWWWIVPFANVVMPFRVMFETARGSSAAPRDSNWRASRLPREAVWWTVLFLGGLVVTNVGATMITEAQDLSAFETGLTVSLIGEVAMIGAAIAAVLMIKSIVLGQEGIARALRVSPGGTAPAALPSASPTLTREPGASDQSPSAGYCVNCGSPVSERDRYCSSCGQAVASPPSDVTKQ